MGQGRPEGRVFQDRGGLVACHQVVRAEVVFAERRGHRADDRQLVEQPRGLRKVFRESHTRQFRGDCLQRAADLRRGLRLGIEGLEVAGPAIEPDQDAGFRLRLQGIFGPVEALQAKVIAKPQAEGRQAANTQQAAPGNAIASLKVGLSFSHDSMIAYEFIADKQAPDEIFKKLPLPARRGILPELLFPERPLRITGIPAQGGQVKPLDDSRR